VPGAEFRRMSVASHRPRSLLHTERNRLSLRSPNHPARLHHYTARPTTADMSIPLIDLRGVSITRYPSVAQLPRSPFSPTRQASPMSAQANPNPNPNPFAASEAEVAAAVRAACETVGFFRAAAAERARVAAEAAAVKAAAAAAAAAAEAEAKATAAAELLQMEEQMAALALRMQQAQAQLGVPPAAPAPHPSAEETMCVVCFDAPKDHIIVPCGHMCVCGACAELLINTRNPSCPVCRRAIRETVKVFCS
jgi:hypothetical protein